VPASAAAVPMRHRMRDAADRPRRAACAGSGASRGAAAGRAWSAAEDVRGSAQSQLMFMLIRPPGTIARKRFTAAACASSTWYTQFQATACAPEQLAAGSRPTACTLPAGPPSPAACARNARCAARTRKWPLHCYERSSQVLETLHDSVQLAWWAHVATLHAAASMHAAQRPPGGAGRTRSLRPGACWPLALPRKQNDHGSAWRRRRASAHRSCSSIMAGDCLFPSWSIKCIAAMAGAVPALHPGSAEAAPRTVEGGPVRDALP